MQANITHQPTKYSDHLDRGDASIAAVLGILSLALYVRTLAPGLLPGDSGEFQVLAYLVGHAHTTGYWVYLLLAKATTLLPIGSIAYRVNLFSALMGALSVGIVYLCAKLVTRNRLAAGIGALAFAFAPTVWSQAIIAEVYTAASVIVALVLFFTLLYGYTQKSIYLFLVAMLGGLSLGIHGSISLFAPGILIFIFIQRPSWRKLFKPIFLGLLIGLAVLLLAFFIVDNSSGPYSIVETSYLPSITAWDLTPADIDAPLERFAFLLSATQWRGNMFNFGEFPKLIGTFIERLWADYQLVLIAAMLLGLFNIGKFKRGLGWLFGIGLLVYLLYTLNYRIGDIYVFYVPLYAYLSTLVAAGINRAIDLTGKLPLPNTGQKAATVAVLVIALSGLVGPFLPHMDYLRAGETHFEFANIMPNDEAESWHQVIATTVAAMEPDAIALIGWNDVYAYYYVAYVELGRDDLYFIEATPYSHKPGMADSLVALIDQNLDTHPIYTETRFQDLNHIGVSSVPTTVGAKRLFRLIR
ncbi:MAG: DUF2723 domain-containing protein [Anaerolineales bacterium]|nr:DUF2723 domain-containing protein [Anaerolineales bacterium]